MLESISGGVDLESLAGTNLLTNLTTTQFHDLDLGPGRYRLVVSPPRLVTFRVNGQCDVTTAP